MADRVVSLGEVAVDSGHLMVVDPCYVLHDGAYDDMCDRILKLHDNRGETGVPGGEFPASGFANGVVFESGLGDGWYHVEAEVGEVPGWGERIKKVTITLIEEDEEDPINPDEICEVCNGPTQGVNNAYCDDCLSALEAKEDDDDD